VAKLLFFPVAFLLLREIKRKPVILIEFQRGVKRFAALAFEAFDDGSLAFGQQFCNLPVG
jgi:hypothetical protein